MQLTSALPPAYAYVNAHGELLKQLGATKVEATDGFTIKATYHSNSAAVNAEALLKDTVWGAKLVIDNQSLTADMPVVSAQGIAGLLDGVAGVDVSIRQARCLGSIPTVYAETADQGLATLLSDLVEPQPTPGIKVQVYYANDVEQ